jgi:hypothetical protein
MACERSRHHLRRYVPTPSHWNGHHSSGVRPLQSLAESVRAESVRGASNRVVTSRVSGSRHHREPETVASRPCAIHLLLPWGADPFVPRAGYAHATTRAGAGGRSRRGIRGSWWTASSIRATSRLTPLLTSAHYTTDRGGRRGPDCPRTGAAGALSIASSHQYTQSSSSAIPPLRPDRLRTAKLDPDDGSAAEGPHCGNVAALQVTVSET